MANVTLASVPSEIDQDKLKQAAADKLSQHDENSDHRDVVKSMNEIVAEIQKGEYGLPQPPKQTFHVQATVGQTQAYTAKPVNDWHVTFTWDF